MTLPTGWTQSLTGMFAKRVRFDEPLSGWTYFRVGGPADALIEVKSEQSLQLLWKMVDEALCEIPLTVLGLGTNVIVRDGGIRGIVVIMSSGFDTVEVKDRADRASLYVGAGVKIEDLTSLCIERGLTGFEFAAGIPGSMGGAVYMNAGTREGEMAKILAAVRLMNPQGEVSEIAIDKLDTSYRHLGLPEGSVILGATLELEYGDKKEIRRKVEKLLNWRKEKQPGDQPCAGSIFKNPGKTAAGRLIDQAGLKGYRIGDAAVSTVHTNFIVNTGNATAGEILALIEHVRQEVKKQSGILLETEVKILGEEHE